MKKHEAECEIDRNHKLQTRIPACNQALRGSVRMGRLGEDWWWASLGDQEGWYSRSGSRVGSGREEPGRRLNQGGLNMYVFCLSHKNFCHNFVIYIFFRIIVELLNY